MASLLSGMDKMRGEFALLYSGLIVSIICIVLVFDLNLPLHFWYVTGSQRGASNQRLKTCNGEGHHFVGVFASWQAKAVGDPTRLGVCLLVEPETAVSSAQGVEGEQERRSQM